jgi:hypothetical protein
MKKTKTLACLSLLAASCASSPAAFTAPCAGTNINSTLTWSPSEIVKGARGLSNLRIASVIVSDDPNAPFHLASGECVGSFFLGAEGGPESGSGYCVRKDKDGDTVYEEWTLVSAGKGTSKVAGGTGKFANASWTYNWRATRLHGPLAAVRWTGDCR